MTRPPRLAALTCGTLVPDTGSAMASSAVAAISWHAADALNNLSQAEFSIDGGDWTVVAPVGGLSDSLELDYELNLDAAPGEHTIAVRVQDDYDNQATDKAVVR